MDAVAPPRVAVIVPARNRADLLPEALDSILAQTYDDWEAVVVDDASTDDTYAVAVAYAERHPGRITALTLRENVGVGAARTIGIRATRGGELICLLDSDDRLLESYLERMIGAFDAARSRGRRPGVVSCDGLILGSEGITGETWFGRAGLTDPIDLDGMLRRNCVLARAIFSRAAYEDVGAAFAAECGGWDDYDLWLRMIEAGYEAIMVPEPLVLYREHAGSHSRDRVTRAQGAIETYRRAIARGALTPRQRRAARRQILHYRASGQWELLYRALTRADRRAAVRIAVGAVPLAVAAFLQQPSRWGSWATRLRREARALRRARQFGADSSVPSA
jgi:glycosyltransferase involved in cell wall biosynthesis